MPSYSENQLFFSRLRLIKQNIVQRFTLIRPVEMPFQGTSGITKLVSPWINANQSSFAAGSGPIILVQSISRGDMNTFSSAIENKQALDDYQAVFSCVPSLNELKTLGFESCPHSLYRAYVILCIFIAIHIEVNCKLLFNVTMKLFNYILSASKQLSSKGFRRSGINIEEFLGNQQPEMTLLLCFTPSQL